MARGRAADRFGPPAPGLSGPVVRRLQLQGPYGEGIADLKVLVLGLAVLRRLFLVRWVRVAFFLIGTGVRAWVGWFPVPGLVLKLVDHLVQLFRGQVGLLEWLSPLAMEQRHLGCFPNVLG